MLDNILSGVETRIVLPEKHIYIVKLDLTSNSPFYHYDYQQLKKTELLYDYVIGMSNEVHLFILRISWLRDIPKSL